MGKKKTVSTIGDKLVKINDSFNIHLYDNGYMVEVSGRNKEGDYATAKIMCMDIAQVHALMEEIDGMERDD